MQLISEYPINSSKSMFIKLRSAHLKWFHFDKKNAINNIVWRQCSYIGDSFTTELFREANTPHDLIFGGLLCPNIRIICQHRKLVHHMLRNINVYGAPNAFYLRLLYLKKKVFLVSSLHRY